MKLHLGCGNIKLEGFINIDIRETIATDKVQDCSNLTNFPLNQIEIIYANAFFEHLNIDQAFKLIKQIEKLLKPDGRLIITGLPDFERIAKAYLNKEPGITRPRFNILEVFRYTHGNPFIPPFTDWHQLHKSLWDIDLIKYLFGFTSLNIYVFRYFYRTEPIDLNFGIIAVKGILSNFDFEKEIKSLNPDIENEKFIIWENKLFEV